MFHPMIVAVAIVLGLVSIPALSADTSKGTEAVTTHLVRTSDGVPAKVTKQACNIVNGSSAEVGNSMMACLRANAWHDTIVSSLKRADFTLKSPTWGDGLVIYDVVITQRDGIGYTVRTLYGSLTMEVSGSIHEDRDVPKILERLNRATLILMNGAKIAIPGELTSPK